MAGRRNVVLSFSTSTPPPRPPRACSLARAHSFAPSVRFSEGAAARAAATDGRTHRRRFRSFIWTSFFLRRRRCRRFWLFLSTSPHSLSRARLLASRPSEESQRSQWSSSSSSSSPLSLLFLATSSNSQSLPPSHLPKTRGGGKLSLSCSHFSGRAFLPQEAEIRHLACPSSSSSFLRLVLAPRSPPGPHSAAPSPSSPAR